MTSSLARLAEAPMLERLTLVLQATGISQRGALALAGLHTGHDGSFFYVKPSFSPLKKDKCQGFFLEKNLSSFFDCLVL